MRAALAVLVLAGCAHEKLVVPPPDAPLEERLKAYEQLKPKSNGARSLVLANRQEVTQPVDLLQVVPPGSETARAVEAYEQKNKPWNTLAPIAGYGFGAGATLATASYIPRLFQPGPQIDTVLLVTTVIGVVVMFGVPLTSLLIGLFTVPDSEAERKSAFSSYDTDLKRKLGLLPE